MHRLFISLLFVTVGWSQPAEAASDQKSYLFIPVNLVAQKLSPAMQELITTSRETGELTRVDRWQPLAELPAWVFESHRRKIGFILPHSLIKHGYRFAIILGTHGEVLRVRTGGLSDAYDIFRKPAVASLQP